MHIIPLTISRYRDIMFLKGEIIMPVISRFYGIIIRMYFQQSEHNPPHFHAIYGEHVAAINIADGTIIEGELPKKALEMVLEWNSIHKDALLKIWETQEFVALSPLEYEVLVCSIKLKKLMLCLNTKLLFDLQRE